jgi:Fic/DOC family
VADWDQDGPTLQVNLERVLAVVTQWANRRNNINAATIKRWHRWTMAGLDVPHAKFVGRFRGEPGLEDQRVFVGTNEGTAPALVIGAVEGFVERLQSVLSELDRLLPRDAELDRDGLQAVIELAAWVHSEWVRIHPFGNGNGRTARVLTHAILMRYGLPPVLRLRPRPMWPYGYAGAEGMQRNTEPMESLLRRLLMSFRSG